MYSYLYLYTLGDLRMMFLGYWLVQFFYIRGRTNVQIIIDDKLYR